MLVFSRKCPVSWIKCLFFQENVQYLGLNDCFSKKMSNFLDKKFYFHQECPILWIPKRKSMYFIQFFSQKHPHNFLFRLYQPCRQARKQAFSLSRHSPYEDTWICLSVSQLPTANSRIFAWLIATRKILIYLFFDICSFIVKRKSSKKLK